MGVEKNPPQKSAMLTFGSNEIADPRTKYCIATCGQVIAKDAVFSRVLFGGYFVLHTEKDYFCNEMQLTNIKRYITLRAANTSYGTTFAEHMNKSNYTYLRRR